MAFTHRELRLTSRNELFIENFNACGGRTSTSPTHFCRTWTVLGPMGNYPPTFSYIFNFEGTHSRCTAAGLRKRDRPEALSYIMCREKDLVEVDVNFNCNKQTSNGLKLNLAHEKVAQSLFSPSL